MLSKNGSIFIICIIPIVIVFILVVACVCRIKRWPSTSKGGTGGDGAIDMNWGNSGEGGHRGTGGDSEGEGR